MNLLLFLIVVIISFVIVRIGAIAFQLTGMEWSQAKFQSLSCFSGTGFTTRESEMVTSSRQRRRIASILIVLGNAGLVTMIAAFANTIRPRYLEKKLPLPFWPEGIPTGWIPFINLLIIVVGIYLIYKIFTNSKITRRLTATLRKRIVQKEVIQPVTFEELTIATGGYGISKIQMFEHSAVLNKKISETVLRQQDITILAIVRNENTLPNPPSDTQIVLGDELICFGKLQTIRTQFFGDNV